RRRHTRFSRDWSSDVCSSDLALQASPAAAVVNVSSGAAHAPREGWSAYCSAKAGLAMLTRSLDLEYRERGVAVFGLQPGVVDTRSEERRVGKEGGSRETAGE